MHCSFNSELMNSASSCVSRNIQCLRCLFVCFSLFVGSLVIVSNHSSDSWSSADLIIHWFCVWPARCGLEPPSPPDCGLLVNQGWSPTVGPWAWLPAWIVVLNDELWSKRRWGLCVCWLYPSLCCWSCCCCCCNDPISALGSLQFHLIKSKESV